MTLVHEREPRDLTTLLIRADIDMDLGARATGPLVTHLPEVIVLIPVDDSLLG